MATTERVTVTLPAELVESIDRLERNRSRFIKDAVEHELARRRHEELRRSLEHPHPEAAELADAGLGEWAASLPEGDEGLVDMSAGTPVRWVESKGWVEEQ
ncbi:MAG: ribbon-helix-helix protein, CopG family [Proteobacteria bacterium]|nr:ribbon-helix-helix protein, CopG family [Pseudomonadota bacterium]